MTEAYSEALQTIINEFKNISPDITHALIFKNNGQTIANTESPTEDQIKVFLTNFNEITQQADAIGGIENLTIEASNTQLNISAMGDLYLATFSTREANQEVIKSLTHVVVPTFVKLVDQHVLQPTEDQPPQPIPIEEESKQETVLPVKEEPKIEPIPDIQPQFEPVPPKTPINQFMVEKIGGLLVPADTVRIDSKVIAKWSDLYEEKQIIKVDIESLDGKKITCKFKAIKEARSNSKGIIQIPEKILQNLQTDNGKLVMVKPVIE